ncbi:MAG: DUF3108 domain-containing protein [Bacteroidales bacterium]|nr:DUF3108 domain-containing protein [Bacteroidales bacterium]
MKKVFIILYILAATWSVASGQCFKNNYTFAEGEEITYTVAYNWGFIWIDAGWVEFKVKPATYINRNVYHLDAFGSTFKSYDWLFKVRDHYQSYLDKETLLPLWHHRKNYEGGYEVDDKYVFDWRNNRVFAYTKNSNQALRKDTVALPNRCTFDLQTLIYYARNLDFSGLELNDTIPVYAIIDYNIYNLYIRYGGKETITLHNGASYRCIKFSALLVEGTMFKGGEDLIVWVTDDKNRVPVLIDAKILVGSVKAYLKEAKGLRNPWGARLN